MKNHSLAIIGSGPTSIYCLKNILDNSEKLLSQFQSISIFEKSEKMGYGMPYNPDTTDIYNLANISSEEIPELFQTFANWLRDQDTTYLKALNVTKFPIVDSEVYSRIALGNYFHNQFTTLVCKLKSVGFDVKVFPNQEVIDIKIINNERPQIITQESKYNFSKIVIATGHQWKNNDEPNFGYFDTPWPIKKILPQPHTFYNLEIGILGASLSAFDVVSSLAHRHGTFSEKSGKLTFQLSEGAEKFKIMLHSFDGWLPHLQYEQEEPFREIYRHTTRETLLKLRDKNGYLKLEDFFNKIGKPALIKAFQKDENKKLVALLKKPTFYFRDFIDEMSEAHEYIDSFEGMKKEIIKAKDSVENKKPIHWMEVLDDLMYCLNFHAELLSAEDHLFFNNEVKPFLMSVIAAFPLNSAHILLALHDANVIDLIAGKVEILNSDSNLKETRIKIISDDNSTVEKTYKMFINCSGNDKVNLDNYPFNGLKNTKNITKALAKFEFVESLEDIDDSSNVIQINNELFLSIGGITVDNTYRIINEKGEGNPNVYNIAFTHIGGCRPYSYGLQACHATSTIMVNSWLSINNKIQKPTSIEIISKIYDAADDL